LQFLYMIQVYHFARRRPGVLGKPELYFLDEIGRFTV